MEDTEEEPHLFQTESWRFCRVLRSPELTFLLPFEGLQLLLLHDDIRPRPALLGCL